MDKYRNMSVFTVCTRIHDAYTGSGGGIDAEELDEAIKYLEYKRDNWVNAINPDFQEYDTAVLKLVYASLGEAYHLHYRQKQ